MTARDPAHDRRQRRLLVGLALLFFAPLGVSFYLYYGPVGWRPGHRVNHGELIDPPRPLPSLPQVRAEQGGAPIVDLLHGKWTLLYVGEGSCPTACRRDLYNTRQVRIALNRDMDRVQRVYIADGECCEWPYLHAEHPDLITIRRTPATSPWVDLLPGLDGRSTPAPDRVYLIDPLGNLMMYFPPDAPPKGILTDLKRLLGLSHVG